MHTHLHTICISTVLSLLKFIQLLRKPTTFVSELHMEQREGWISALLSLWPLILYLCTALTASISSYQANQRLVVQVNFWLIHFSSWLDINGRLKTSLRGKAVTTDLCGQKHKQTSQISVSQGRVYWLARLCFIAQYICFHCRIHALFSNLDSEKLNNKCRLSWALTCLKAEVLKWIFQNTVFSYSCTIAQTWRQNWDFAENSEINQAVKISAFFLQTAQFFLREQRSLGQAYVNFDSVYKGFCPSQRPHQTDYQQSPIKATVFIQSYNNRHKVANQKVPHRFLKTRHTQPSGKQYSARCQCSPMKKPKHTHQVYIQYIQ